MKLTSVSQIRKGMVLVAENGKRFRFVRLARYCIYEGNQIPISNERKNKWDVVDEAQPDKAPEIMCLDDKTVAFYDWELPKHALTP